MLKDHSAPLFVIPKFILDSEAERNEIEQMNYSAQNLNAISFVLHPSAPRPNMNFDLLIIRIKLVHFRILGDPGADSGDEGKSKRAEKYIWREEK